MARRARLFLYCLAAWPAPAASTENVPGPPSCPYFLVDLDADGSTESRSPIPLDSRLCRRLEALGRRVEGLAWAAKRWTERAAGELGVAALEFDVGRVRLSKDVINHPESNGEFHRGSLSIRLTSGAAEDPNEESVNFLLAHECGHAAQRALGKYGGCTSSYEAQADLWGIEISREASIPATRPHSGVAHWFGGAWLRSETHAEQRGCEKYPTGRQRMVNALLADAAGVMSTSAAGRLRTAAVAETAGAAFDGGGARSAPAELPQGHSPPVPTQAVRRRTAGQSDFTTSGSLVVTTPIRPPPRTRLSDAERRAYSTPAEALRLALYELGNRSGWTDPFLLRVLSYAATEASDLDSAIVRGSRWLYPSSVAAQGAADLALKLAEAYPED